MRIAPLRRPLADGRELLFFSLPGRTPAPVPDRRPLPTRTAGAITTTLRPSTGEWVIVAALRQDRTYTPRPTDARCAQGLPD